MTLTIELRPELEAGLRQIAAGQGVSVAHFVQRLLEQTVPVASQPPLSPEQRAALWRASVQYLPRTTPLPDSAISRESLYAERG